MNLKNMQWVAVVVAVFVVSLPAMAASVSAPGADDYLDKPEMIRKWLPDRMPLTVYIKPGDGVPGFRPEYTQLAKDAFEEWSAAANGEFKFRFVDDAKQAVIRVSWTDDPAKLAKIEPFQAGSAEFIVGDFGIDSANIVLLTSKPVSLTKMTDNSMHWAILHEIGHAMGLSHSDDTHDLMYHGFSDAADAHPPVISERDSRTITKLYSDSVKFGYLVGDKRHTSSDPGMKISPNADNAAGMEAMNKGDFPKAIAIFEKLYNSNPTSRTFQENYAGTLSNASNAANNKGAYDTAIGYLERALKIDPGLDAAKQNLVIALNGKATQFLTAGKPALSEPFYKRALELTIPLSRKELLKMTVNNYSIALMRLGRQAEATELKAKYASVMGAP